MECAICSSLLSESADCDAPKSAKRANGVANGVSEGQLCCLPCGHIFHKYCALNWLEAKNKKNAICTCPICRKEFKETRQLRNVFLPTVDNVSDLMKRNEKLEKERDELKKEVEMLKEKIKEEEEEKKKNEEEKKKNEEEKKNGGEGKMDFYAAWNKWRNSL